MICGCVSICLSNVLMFMLYAPYNNCFCLCVCLFFQPYDFYIKEWNLASGLKCRRVMYVFSFPECFLQAFRYFV